MAVAGRKPKPQGQAVNRNKPTHEWTEVDNVPFTGAPRLPTEWINGMSWPKRTKQTWKAWSTMPHCALWTDSDWAFAMDSLTVAASFHTTGQTNFATELRNREKVMGTTAEFRRDLRIRYVDPKPEGSGDAEVTNIADYRNL